MYDSTTFSFHLQYEIKNCTSNHKWQRIALTFLIWSTTSYIFECVQMCGWLIDCAAVLWWFLFCCSSDMSGASNTLAREFLTDVHQLCSAVAQRAEAREEDEEESHMVALGEYLVRGRGFLLLSTLDSIIDQVRMYNATKSTKNVHTPMCDSEYSVIHFSNQKQHVSNSNCHKYV